MLSMVRLAAVALMVVGLSMPAWAQHGGGGGHAGGGFAGHSAGGFGHSGGFSGPRFSAPRSGGFTGRRYFAPRSGGFSGYSSRPGYQGRSYYQGGHSYPSYRSGWNAPNGERGFRDDRFRGRYFDLNRGAFGYFVPNWIGLGPLGCYDDANVYGDDYYDFGYDYGCGAGYVAQDQPMVYGGDDNGPPEQQLDPNYGDSPEFAPEPQYQQPQYGPPGATPPPPPDVPQQRYQPPAQKSAPSMPTTETATTIIFKDGRPSEQIHNYAMTQWTIFVMDQQHHQIPLEEVDVAATEKANQAVGIDFQVPESAQ
jgi:hypothetical protein